MPWTGWLLLEWDPPPSCAVAIERECAQRGMLRTASVQVRGNTGASVARGPASGEKRENPQDVS